MVIRYKIILRLIKFTGGYADRPQPGSMTPTCNSLTTRDRVLADNRIKHATSGIKKAVDRNTLTLGKPASEDAATLKKVFQSIDAQSCPHFFNFHTHTTYSDGKLKPQESIEQAIEIGLQGLAITDHNTVGGYEVARGYLDYRTKELLAANSDRSIPYLWIGVEINAELLGSDVHILGYAFNPKHLSIEMYLQGNIIKGNEGKADRVIAAIHDAGGLAVLAHPFRYRRSPDELIAEAARLGIDGVETYYAYGNPNPWQPSPEQTKTVQQLSAYYGLLNTCGTDTHGVSLLLRI